MKLLPFAKLFEVQGGQVLVYKSYDVEDDMYTLNQMVSTEEGVSIEIAKKFKSEGERDESYEKYGHLIAEHFANAVTENQIL